MIQVYLEGPRRLVQEEVPLPEPAAHQVLVRVRACGVCSTDVHSYEGQTIQGNRYPFHPGHEVAGEVHRSGAECRTLREGDRVVVDPFFACEQCPACREGLQNHCSDRKTIGIVGPGGFSDFVVVPEKNAYRFGRMGFSQAAFAEPLATVIYGARRLGLRCGERLLIAGAGPIGLLHLQLALRSGASQVVVSDLNPRKLKLARELGAAEAVPVADARAAGRLGEIAGRGFDAVIDCTGVPQVLEQSLGLLGRGGRLLVFGVCPQESAFPLRPFDLYRRDLSIVGSFALNRSAMKAAVELLDAGRIDTERLTAAVLPRERLEEALASIRDGRVDGKVVIRQEESN